MKIADLNVGDLLRFNYKDPRWECDLGIVMQVVVVDPCLSPEVVVHWSHEEDNPCYHDDSEMNEWLRDGLVEVINENP